jgi:DNA-binding response OmpR family regulator
MMQILLVEDERAMAELLRRGLTEEGHQTALAHDGLAGLEMAQTNSFDVIVLDMMLPRLDGIGVARRLREGRNQTPILMLTAKDAPAHVIAGLDAGADDYLTKPFSFEILLARLRAVSRRGAIPRPVCLEAADLKLDPATRRVTRAGEAVNLTPREFSLLELLLRNQGRVVSRETILESVWGFDCDVSGNTLEAFVRLLRLKVDTREPKLIQTVRGIGYSLREP